MIPLFGRRTGFMGNDAYTALLYHFDGSHLDTSTVDSSRYNHTVTFGGNKALYTTQQVFGPSSLGFNSTGGILTVPNHACFDFGAGDFTLETWGRFGTLPATSGSTMLFQKYVDASNYWNYYIYNSAGTYQLRFASLYLGSPRADYYATITPSINTWYHLACVRNGTGTGCIKMYLGGTQLSTTEGYAIGASVLPHFSTTVSVGNISAWIGGTYYDEMRISSTARWTSNFTPQGWAYR